MVSEVWHPHGHVHGQVDTHRCRENASRVPVGAEVPRVEDSSTAADITRTGHLDLGVGHTRRGDGIARGRNGGLQGDI